ncbi:MULTISPECIES: Fe(3+)-hydroxamate ABC transporter permease FhuB [unclassified Rhizobium]|uniref:Fe(3+)-hydroxamate ABC transporter permease FhuB n=1 Tax=unclassified Rhizobium TaxID=2613769 RepID=UPI000B2610AF|nr:MULTISPECIES: Fe(3+)-hydroxamate ABC transporter permease FhuB [unclassified Rhizobium]RKD52013.1 iron complex transport system permease protein [Rhizobium sp. WW_1]
MISKIAAADKQTQSVRSLAIILVLAIIAFALCLSNLSHLLPPDEWSTALFHPSDTDIAQLVAHETFFPRLVMSLLAGAGLAVVGALLQHVLSNPLADAATLGITGGAYVVVVATTFWLPSTFLFSTETAALLGGCGAAVLVIGIAWRRRLEPLAVILAGLVVGLYASTLASTMILFHGGVRNVFIWAAGSLNVQGWHRVVEIMPGLAIALVLLILLRRPLVLLSLNDEGAKSLGLPLSLVRFLILIIAIVVAAQIVSTVGPISFIGLIAPALARLSNTRTVGRQLSLSALMGAMLLWLVDQSVQAISTAREIPTGAAVALIGSPILLVLLPKMRSAGWATEVRSARAPESRKRFGPFFFSIACLILLVSWLSLSLGLALKGWHWSHGQELVDLSYWRGPRLIAAFCGGAAIALAGAIMQRVTGNAMASPEVLGVSTGAALGVIIMLLCGFGLDRVTQTGGAFAGAFFTMATLLLLSRRSSFSPDRMIYVGIALTTLFSGLVSVLMGTGDPRMAILFRWLSGSTWLAQPIDAAIMAAILVTAALSLPFMLRWLNILPLGASSAGQLGVDLDKSRFCLLLVIALLAGASTLIVGPMSFVGVIAPHAARMLGQVRTAAQLTAAALIGGLIMMSADWLGRVVLFPDQMPAGLLAALIGGPYFLWLMQRRPN